jgi:predicted DNA-binding transcriptional regulator AlpA
MGTKPREKSATPAAAFDSTRFLEEHRLVRCQEFVRLLNLSRARFYQLKAEGFLPPPIAFPGRPRWNRQVVLEFLRTGYVHGARRR